ncbi:DUF4230 domain-containing protein [Eubacterium oxidoreducens]|nr:DUF4230 domain-containing protein [Eubacterium oxidoreducens]
MKSSKVARYFWCVVVIIIVIVVGIVAFKIYSNSHNKTVSEVYISDLIKIERLYMMDIPISGVVTVTKEKKDGKKEDAEYIHYQNAVVSAYIDVEDIEVKVDKENQEIDVTMPKAEFTNASIEYESKEILKRIRTFNDEDVDIDHLIVEDAKEKASKFRDTVEDTAQDTIYELIDTLVNDEETQYTIKVSVDGEAEDDEK